MGRQYERTCPFVLLRPLPRFSSASSTLHDESLSCPHGVHSANFCLFSSVASVGRRFRWHLISGTLTLSSRSTRSWWLQYGPAALARTDCAGQPKSTIYAAPAVVFGFTIVFRMAILYTSKKFRLQVFPTTFKRWCGRLTPDMGLSVPLARFRTYCLWAKYRPPLPPFGPHASFPDLGNALGLGIFATGSLLSTLTRCANNCFR